VPHLSRNPEAQYDLGTDASGILIPGETPISQALSDSRISAEVSMSILIVCRPSAGIPNSFPSPSKARTWMATAIGTDNVNLGAQEEIQGNTWKMVFAIALSGTRK